MGSSVDRLLAVDPYGLKAYLGCIVRVEAVVFKYRDDNPYTDSKRPGRQFMWLLKPVKIAHALIDHVWVQGCKRNKSWKIGTVVKFTAKLSYYEDPMGPKFVVRSPFRAIHEL